MDADSLSPTKEDDPTLVARIRTGDEQAFESLFRKYYTPLVAFATLYASSVDTARDAVCDVFAALYERRATWRVTSSVQGYLFRAVRNQILHQARTARREHTRYAKAREHDEEVLFISPAEPADANLITLEDEARRRAMAHDILTSIPDHTRAILALRLDRGLSYEEIAEVMESTPAAVKMQLSRTLRALRKRFAPDPGPG